MMLAHGIERNIPDRHHFIVLVLIENFQVLAGIFLESLKHFAAVSYTHLDVYKRQPMPTPFMNPITPFVMTRSTPFNCGIGFRFFSLSSCFGNFPGTYWKAPLKILGFPV